LKSITLTQARQAFKFTNQTENKSPKTTEWYERLLSRFEAFMATLHPANPAGPNGGAGSPLLAKITTEDIRQFIACLQGQTAVWENHPFHRPVAHPLSPQTIRAYVRALSALFHWAVAERLIAENPMAQIQKPKVPKVIKDAFKPEEIQRLLAACEQYSPSIAQRNRAILLFLLDTGVRAGELVTLTRDRVDLERKTARVTGKGAKDRYVSFGNLTAKALLYYLSERPEAMLVPANVFLTRELTEMKVGTLQLVLRDLGKRAQVAHCHPHRFRHTAARILLRNGLNVFALQQLMGHEDLRTTRGYVALEQDDLEKAYQRASPVDRWNLK
jgi:integrase/recombinase XerD